MSSERGPGGEGSPEGPGHATSTGGDERTRERLLRNPIRQAIVETLSRTPGLNKNQLADELDAYPNLVEFHLERLEDHGLVVVKPSARDQEHLCFLAEDEPLWEDEDTRILFGRESPRKIATYVASNPGASTADIADAVDLARVTVRHHLRTLREHDVVQQVPAGRSYKYHPRPTLTGWMDEVGHAFVPEDVGWTQGSTEP